MTLADAARAGHARVRLAMWGNPEDYVHLYLMPEGYGPWGRLYSPVQLQFEDIERPQVFLLIGANEGLWEPYTGAPAPDEKPW